LKKLSPRHQPGFGRISDAVRARRGGQHRFLLSMQIQIMYLHTLMPTPRQPLRETLIAEVRAAADTCAGWNARLAARRITGFLNRRMQDSSLSLAQFGLIAQIASARDDTLSELAQRTGLDQSTLSRNLQVLEAAGLVEMAAGEKDARRRAVWLTEKGAQSLETGLANWKRAHGELAKRLDPAAARRLAVAAEALEEG
jgi:DNA-binding MarR family transcriptional regulator